MANIKQPIGAPASKAVTGLSSLSSGAYGVSVAINNTTNQPLDLIVELSATPGTVGGNKQAVLFAKSSLDGSTYSSGPESGSTATDEADLVVIGYLPLNSNTTPQTKHFSVASAFGGVLPPYLKFVVKNDSGGSFSAGSLSVSEVSGTVT